MAAWRAASKLVFGAVVEEVGLLCGDLEDVVLHAPRQSLGCLRR